MSPVDSLFVKIDDCLGQSSREPREPILGPSQRSPIRCGGTSPQAHLRQRSVLSCNPLFGVYYLIVSILHRQLVSQMSGAQRGQPKPAFAGAGADSERDDLLSGTVPSGSQPTTESQTLIPRQVSSESMSRAEIESRFAGVVDQLGILMSMVAALGPNPSSSQSRTASTSGEGTTSASSTNPSDNKPETVANFHDSGQEGNSVGQATSIHRHAHKMSQ